MGEVDESNQVSNPPVVISKADVYLSDPTIQSIINETKQILHDHFLSIGDAKGMNASDLGAKLLWSDQFKTRYGPLKKFYENFTNFFKIETHGSTVYIGLVELPDVPPRSYILDSQSSQKFSLKFPFPSFYDDQSQTFEDFLDNGNLPASLLEKCKITKYLSFNNQFEPIFSSTIPNVSNSQEPIISNGARQYDLETFLSILPESIHLELLKIPNVQDNLIEVIMDLGRVPCARFTSINGQVSYPLSSKTITREELELITNTNSRARVKEFASDNRTGIDSTLHRVSRILNRNNQIVGLTCRYGRALSGTAEKLLQDYLSPYKLQSMLILGPPGKGKTTLLRDISRILADKHGLRVVIIDTSNELGGDGDIAHPGIGSARRLQVPSRAHQHQLMVEAICNHTPEVIVVDEISNLAEAAAAQTIAQRGIRIIATAHGTFTGFVKNPILCGLLGGTNAVTLGDQRAKYNYGGKKSVLERVGEPTFDVCIELESFDSVAVYNNTSFYVDMLLAGNPCIIQTRRKVIQSNTETVIVSHRVEY